MEKGIEKKKEINLFAAVTFMVIVALAVGFLLLLVGSFVIDLFTKSAHGDEILPRSSQPPAFNEFERWFGPAPKGNERTHQLFEATKLLLKAMEQNPRDMQLAAETIPCKLTADQWQDVIGVALSYRIWQEIYLLRDEVSKLSSVATDLNRLEIFLRASLKEVLDEQVKTNEKIDALQKSVDSLAKKIGGQLDDLLAKSREQIRLMNLLHMQTIQETLIFGYRTPQFTQAKHLLSVFLERMRTALMKYRPTIRTAGMANQLAETRVQETGK